MVVSIPSTSCCVLNHHNIFCKVHNALAFDRDTCVPSSTLLTFASFPCKSIVSCHFPLLLPSSHLCNDSFNYGGKKAVVHRPLDFQPRLPSLDKPMCTWLTEPTSLLRYGINKGCKKFYLCNLLSICCSWHLPNRIWKTFKTDWGLKNRQWQTH